MVSIGSHSADAEKNQGFQGTDVLICVPEPGHIVVVGISAGRSAVGASRQQPVLFCVDPVDEMGQGIVIKINIGNCCKEAFQDETVGLRGLFCIGSGMSQTDQCPGQLILKFCVGSRFAADTGFPRASGTAGSLFTLETKHGCIHNFFSFQNLSKIRPSAEIVTTFHGINLLLFFRAVTAARSMPPQHGTSIRVTVRLLIVFVRMISVNFSV